MSIEQSSTAPIAAIAAIVAIVAIPVTFSAKGAAISQPRATPWVTGPPEPRAESPT